MITCIIGTSFNYNGDETSIFVKSARQNGFDGDIIMVGDSINETQKKFYDQNGVIFHGGHEKPARFFVSRWHSYIPYLEAGNWDYVFASDLRDVVFQVDISSLMTNGLNVTEESANIGKENYNSQQVVEGWGQEALSKIADRTILCAGTVWGDRKSIINLCEYFWNNRVTADQGVLNYAVYNNLLDATINSNGLIVWTLGLEGYSFEEAKLYECEYFINHNRIAMPSGYIPPVLHQWDRHAKLKGIIEEMYR